MSNNNFFNYSVPLLRRKQKHIPDHEVLGLRRIHWQIGEFIIHTGFYTGIDQACILWSLLIIPMFVTAQFFPMSWTLQAYLWSILSLLGTAMMVNWTQYWVKIERVSWTLYIWVILMLVGLLLTNLGIFFGRGEILINLCPLWLGLSTLGYLTTGIAVRSRALIFVSIFHLLSIFILPHISEWQFLTTGCVIVSSLLLLAEFQWDMRSI